MIILDAYAVLAYLKGEPAAGEVRALLDHNDTQLTVSGIAEVLDHLVRLVGVDRDEASLDLAQLGLLDAPGLEASTTAAAGLLRALHYHRKSRAVSLADCIAAQVAREQHASLATSDPHLLDLCHTEGIAVEVLTASDGSRWSPK